MAVEGERRAHKADAYTLEGEHRHYMLARTAAVQAKFLLDHLRPGFRVLDAGCGAGAITMGMAKAVAPGEVIGIDREASQVDAAIAAAHRRGTRGVTFQVADVYSLPFGDNSFDALFSNAVLEHLSEPLRALREFRRVLRTDGIVGIRNADGSGNLLHPDMPLLRETFEAGRAYRRRAGGDYTLGSRTKELLLEAGFTVVEVSASYETDSTRETIHRWAEMAAAMCKAGPFADGLVAAGLMARDRLARAAQAWLDWAEMPNAFQARAWVEGLGRKT